VSYELAAPKGSMIMLDQGANPDHLRNARSNIGAYAAPKMHFHKFFAKSAFAKRNWLVHKFAKRINTLKNRKSTLANQLWQDPGAPFCPHFHPQLVG